MDRKLNMAAAVFLSAGLLVAPCMGQSTATPAKQTSPDQATSCALVRLALLDLRAIEEPKPRDYGVTESLLQVAQSLAPNDGEIARRLSEAAWSAADQDVLISATRRVIELDPKDTVAQLRLLTAQIGHLQTAGERLAAYDRALGPAGAGLDAAIRSRLALDAALLRRERGDTAGYMQHLKMAVLLDATNKEAAFLAVEAYSRVDDPMGRLELLSNLLMADPLEPRVLGEIRDVLASGGACKAASRFHEILARIMQASGAPDDGQMDLMSLVLKWRLEGARPALAMLQEQLDAARRNVERAAEANAKGGLAYSRRPEDTRLSLAFEEARLGAAIVLGQDDELSRSFTDLSKSIQTQVDMLADRNRRPGSMSEEQAQEGIARASQLMQCWRSLIGALEPGGLQPPTPKAKDMTVEPATSLATPAVPQAVSPTVPPSPAADDASPLVAGWLAIGAGDMELAKRRFAEVENTEDAWLLMGQAVAAEKSEGGLKAVLAYHTVVEQAPMTVLGAMASHREADLTQKLGTAAPATSPHGAAMEAFAKTIPAWVDGMLDQPWNFESMRAEPVENKTSVLQQTLLRVRIRNLSPIPLGLGAGRPINTRLLLNPALEAGGRVQAPDGEVVDLNRRLRLLPGEEFECVVWPEAGISGYAVEMASTFPTRVSWRVLQGFEARGDASRDAGPGCVEVHTGSVLHEALVESRLPAEELAKRLDEPGDSQLPALLVGARVAMSKGDAGVPMIVDAIVHRFPQWSATSKILAISTLPPTGKVGGLSAFDDLLVKETDPRVMMVAVVARAKSADDPILSAAAAMNDAALAKVVSAQRERLIDGVRTYSQTGIPERAEKSPEPVPAGAAGTPAPTSSPSPAPAKP